MKNFKRVISVILCVCLLASSAAVIGSAEEKKSDADCPIVFVTGIGQSSSYRYDSVEDKEADIADNSTDRANADWNLFCNDFGFAFKEVGTYFNILAVVGGLLATLSGVNCVPEFAVNNIVKTLFRYNIIDEEGQLPDTMYTPCYKYSVADMTDDQKETFYKRIPCKEVIGNIGEDMLYVFNYSAFSFTFDNSDNLNDFINNYVLPQTGCEKVVLVPMSMGASVVSAYLHDYGQDGKVSRVVSIVGAWDGSTVFSDLINLQYADNAPEMIYSSDGVLSQLLGEPLAYILNPVIRSFQKDALRSVIDEILNSLVEEFILKTPSLLALIPKDEYLNIRKTRLEGNDDLAYIMEQTDRYYQVQCDLEDTFKTLTEQGVDFFFIAGYGVEFGGTEGSDYGFFKFMKSSATTNSDEIIQISSTVPGATYVAYNAQFDEDYLASHDAKYISPEKNVDVSTAFNPDRVWLFTEQKHELENNNTALRLALNLACGKIKSSAECTDTFPIYNESRFLKRLNNYIGDLNLWLETNTPTAEQQQLIDKNTKAVNEMKARTINDRDEDDKIIEEYRQMLITLGVYGPDEVEEESTANVVLKKICDVTYDIFGAKGYVDILKFWKYW